MPDGHLDPFAPQLVPDLAGAIETKAGLMDTRDLRPDPVIASGTSRALVGIGKPLTKGMPQRRTTSA